MTWFKVDDGFWSHPKTATLSDAAVTLWVRAGSYCCQHLTDGFVKQAQIRLLGEAAAAAELVEAFLWHEVDGGWDFHDWDEYQETSVVVKKRRDDARERQRKSREQREEQRRSSQRDSDVTDVVTDSVSNGVSSQPPTRPDPTRPTEEKNDLAPQATPPKSKPRKRIPDDYMPSRHVIDKVKAEYPAVSDHTFKALHEDFCLYWKGQGKPMADWDATWLRWFRKELTKQTAATPFTGPRIAASDAAFAQAQALKLVVPDDRLELP